jgi:hypothetical protein
VTGSSSVLGQIIPFRNLFSLSYCGLLLEVYRVTLQAYILIYIYIYMCVFTVTCPGFRHVTVSGSDDWIY